MAKAMEITREQNDLLTNTTYREGPSEAPAYGSFPFPFFPFSRFLRSKPILPEYFLPSSRSFLIVLFFINFLITFFLLVSRPPIRDLLRFEIAKKALDQVRPADF